LTPLPGNWRKGSKRRLNSEINKSPPPTTKETTSSPGLPKSVENKIGFDKGVPGGDKTVIKEPPAYGTPELDKLPEPPEPTEEDFKKLIEDSNFKHNEPVKKTEPVKTIELPKELIFGFENKKVKFISEEKLKKAFKKIDDESGYSIGNPIFDRLKQELGL